MALDTLTDIEAALQLVLRQVSPLSPEACDVEHALGRALADDVKALRTLPPWNYSAMDGYALRSADAPGALKVTQTLFAGQTTERAVQPGECARIMTGAPMPPGADAVVMQERVTVDGDTVRIEGKIAPGLNVRQQGEDAREGETLLAAHTPLGLGEAGLLWAQGLTQVTVPRRPTVAIASSGDELRPLGDSSGKIIDTNSPMLALAVQRAGGLPTRLGIASDTLPEVTALFARGLSSDVLLTIAGASVGDKDFARPALEANGVEVIFHRLAIKPAKPVLFGRKGQTLVFALPGNPTSALVAFELLVKPALRAMAGLDPRWPRVPGRLSKPFTKPKGLHHFIRATAEHRDGALWATTLPSQTSGALASAAGASYLLSIPKEVERLEEGAAIDLIPVTWLQ